MLRRRTVGIPPFPHLTSCRSGKESANRGVFTASVTRFLGFCRSVAFAYRSGFVMRPAFTTPEVGPGRSPHRGSTTAALPGNRLSPDLISRSRSRTPQGIAPPVRSESHGKIEPCAVGPNAPRVPFVRVGAEGLSSLKHNPARFFPLTTGCPSCRIPSNAVSRSSTLSVVAHPLRVFSFPPVVVCRFVTSSFLQSLLTGGSRRFKRSAHRKTMAQSLSFLASVGTIFGRLTLQEFERINPERLGDFLDCCRAHPCPAQHRSDRRRTDLHQSGQVLSLQSSLFKDRIHASDDDSGDFVHAAIIAEFSLEAK